MSSEVPVHRTEGPGTTREPTVLGLSAADQLVLLVGVPVVGVLLGFLLPGASRWISQLPLPMLGVFKLIALPNTVWVVVVCVTIGFLLSVAVAVAGVKGSLTVTISDAEIGLERDKATRTIARSDVDAVFADGKKLVVLDRESRQLVRETPEAKPAQLAQAFGAYGYPWVERDPYADLYQKWVPDTPDLPSAVNALLAAREVALRKKVAKDAARLRDEVQNFGFVLRDEGTHQFWRPLIRS